MLVDIDVVVDVNRVIELNFKVFKVFFWKGYFVVIYYFLFFDLLVFSCCFCIMI